MGQGAEADWPRLPASVDVGDYVRLRWRPTAANVKKPAKPKETLAKVVGYEPAVPRVWSSWQIHFLDPEIAKEGHDWNGVGISNGRLYCIDRLPYRTVYEAALARALVG